ncbi:MAG: ribosomal protein S18-alanine N-acetyltransferase [Candidatus Aminicenantes bacterium]|jgi:ribosomal-protein-alanine N-acetyltransferase|nr:ribosomal protein S18-alanine N-acetyltransferase [Candidatus Aminicenantes bacterium]
MKETDIPAVHVIEELSFFNPWSDATFRGEVQNRGISFPAVIIHEPDQRVAGYIIYWHIRDEVQINNMALHPDFRGLGIGEAVLTVILKEVRGKGATFVTLEVRPSNTPAVSLYWKLGFKVLGTRKGYYSNPVEDAYVMGLALGG